MLKDVEIGAYILSVTLLIGEQNTNQTSVSFGKPGGCDSQTHAKYWALPLLTTFSTDRH
jgi:hypothetical protein